MKRFWRLETKSRVKALRGRLTLLCGGVMCFSGCALIAGDLALRGGVLLLAGGLTCFSGCALIMEPQVELEAVDAEFYYDPHSESLPSAYSVKLPERRMIRRVVIHSLDPIRGTDIYVRDGEDEWRLVKEVKRYIEGATRIKVRATGDAVRVIPKTYALGVITKVEVFAVPD